MGSNARFWTDKSCDEKWREPKWGSGDGIVKGTGSCKQKCSDLRAHWVWCEWASAELLSGHLCVHRQVLLVPERGATLAHASEFRVLEMLNSCLQGNFFVSPSLTLNFSSFFHSLISNNLFSQLLCPPLPSFLSNPHYPAWNYPFYLVSVLLASLFFQAELSRPAAQLPRALLIPSGLASLANFPLLAC